MAALAAANLGMKVHVYSDIENSPGSHVAHQTTVASYDDAKAMAEFARSVDVVSFEFENIPHQSVAALEELALVRPSSKALYFTQNRLREKAFINESGIQTARYAKIESVSDLVQATKEISQEGILKTVEMGYDGKGQLPVKAGDDLTALWAEFGHNLAIFEQKIAFEKEISVVIARSISGETRSFTPSENVHCHGILDHTSVPAAISETLKVEAEKIAATLAKKMGMIGILAVEMFVVDGNTLLVNEMAPRPHNSGHWTMDGCVTSQFEQFIRAICGLPLGSIRMHTPTRMQNLIGEAVHQWQDLMQDPDVKLHLYGKKQAREGRKMGHYNRFLGKV